MIGDYGGSERYSWLSLERMLANNECTDWGFVKQCVAALNHARHQGWQIDYDIVFFESNADARFLRATEFYSKFQCRVESGSGAIARVLFAYFADHPVECDHVAGVVENLKDILIWPRELSWGPRVPSFSTGSIASSYGSQLFYFSNF